MPSPEALPDRKSSSIITIGNLNFIFGSLSQEGIILIVTDRRELAKGSKYGKAVVVFKRNKILKQKSDPTKVDVRNGTSRYVYRSI
jgi:hypothetical protein